MPWSGRDPLSAVVLAFQGPTLLYLDNVEDGAVAPGSEIVKLLGYLRYRCPELVLLSTSRCRLGVAEETIYHVAGFSVPDESTEIDPETGLSCNPGIAMLQDALQKSSKGRIGIKSDLLAIARLVREVGGLPLSLEMLAARAAVSGALPALDDVKQSAASPRQSVEWALHAVSPAARALLAPLAVFRETFTVEDAEQVLSESGADYLLAELDDVALVSVVRGLGTLRYRLLPAVLDWATERLSSEGRLMEIEISHARHFAALSLEGATAVGSDLRRNLALALPNCISAIDHLIASGRFDSAAESADALGHIFDFSGRYGEGESLLERLKSTLESHPEASLRSRAYLSDCLGRLQARLMKDGEGIKNLEFALESWKTLGDTVREGRAAGNLGVLNLRRQDFVGAEKYFDQALCCYVKSGEEARKAVIFINKASLYMELERWDEAHHALHQALHISEKLDDATEIRVRFADLAETEILLGRDRDALTHLEQCLCKDFSNENYLRVAQAGISLGVLKHRSSSKNEAVLQLLEQAFGCFESFRSRRSRHRCDHRRR